MNLSRLVLDEFKEMLRRRKGNFVVTETPLYRGGLQELCDEQLIDFVREDGLKTCYELTKKGQQLAATL